MSLKSKLLASLVTFGLVGVGCASNQAVEASSTVEELPSEATSQQPATPAEDAPSAVKLNKLAPPDGFAVLLPGEPNVQRNKVTIPDGEVQTAAWASNINGALYSISIADYPEKVITSNAPQRFLNDARMGLINQLKGTLKSEESLTLQGYPGSSYTVSSDAGEVKARNYLVGNRLYTLLVLFNPSIGAPGSDEFLGSLELINPPPPVAPASSTAAPAADPASSTPASDAAAPAPSSSPSAPAPAPKSK